MGYSKVTIGAKYSDVENFSSTVAELSPTVETATPAGYYHQRAALAAGGVVSLDLGPSSIGMSLPEALIVSNKGASTMTIKWYRLLGTITNPGGNGFKFLNEGNADYDDGQIQDTDGNSKFAGVAVGDLLVISNANLAANDSTRTVGRVNLNEDDVTVTPSPATDASDTTATMLRFQENVQTIAPETSLVIPTGTDGLSSAVPLSIESSVATTYEIFIVG